MSIPSIKTLSRITDKPKKLRAVLKCSTWAELNKLLDSGEYPGTSGWIRQCYNMPSFHELKMSMADRLCSTCGVELIPAGRGAKSPSIEYLNAGDTYATTLLYVRGQYRVGCWGDIVERGNYD